MMPVVMYGSLQQHRVPKQQDLICRAWMHMAWMNMQSMNDCLSVWQVKLAWGCQTGRHQAGGT